MANINRVVSRPLFIKSSVSSLGANTSAKIVNNDEVVNEDEAEMLVSADKNSKTEKNKNDQSKRQFRYLYWEMKLALIDQSCRIVGNDNDQLQANVQIDASEAGAQPRSFPVLERRP